MTFKATVVITIVVCILGGVLTASIVLPQEKITINIPQETDFILNPGDSHLYDLEIISQTSAKAILFLWFTYTNNDLSDQLDIKLKTLEDETKYFKLGKNRQVYYISIVEGKNLLKLEYHLSSEVGNEYQDLGTNVQVNVKVVGLDL